MTGQHIPHPVAGLADLRRHFDAEARYREAHGDEAALLAYRVGLLRDLLDLRPQHRLLEVGCGDGRHLLALAPFVGSAVGVDLSDAMLRRAAERAVEAGIDRLAFVASPAETLPRLPPSSIDRAFFVGSLEHVQDQMAALRSLARMLRPGGRIAILTPNGGSLFYRWLAPAFRIETRRLATDRYLSRGTLRRMLGEAGFVDVRARFWTFVQRGDLSTGLAHALAAADRIGRLVAPSLLRGGLAMTAVLADRGDEVVAHQAAGVEAFEGDAAEPGVGEPPGGGGRRQAAEKA